MKFVIRADANSNIGQGHVMRCLSLADALCAEGNPCVFVTAGDSIPVMIERRGYKALILGTCYDEMDSETDELLKILDDEKADVLIVDSYFVTKDYFDILKGKIKTVYFDDVYSFAYNVDCLINYNIYADEEKYKDIYLTGKVKEPRFILGSKFAPLRKEFIREENFEINEIKNIMVSVGGADPLHLALEFVRRFSAEDFLKDKKIKMVLGRMEPDIEEIKKTAGKEENIEILVDITNMREMILDSDILISAAGSTQYEICACERPCICFSMADNQVEGGKKFEELGAFVYAGDARNNVSFFDDVINALKKLILNEEIAREMGKKAGEITDGRGAGRIVKELERFFGR